MPDAVRARALSFRYAGKDGAPALADCSFHVREGEVYGVLGPNGAGKTTLLRILGTALVPTSGDLEVLGRGLPGGERDVRAALGVAVGEYDRTFDHRLTGEQNLRYFAAFYPTISRGEAKARSREALALVGLSDAASKAFGAYSQGMKHRLALARALLPRPRLLLLDEPTSGVDVTTARAFLGVVRGLAAAGAAVVYTTHRLAEAGDICDRVLILREGRGAAEESPDALRRLSVDTDVLDLRVDPPADAALLATLRAIDRVTGVFPTVTGGVRVHYRPDSDAPFLVFDALRTAGRRVRDVKRDAPSVEDAFLRVTGGASA